MTVAIHDFLHQMGVTAVYRGFAQSTLAVLLVIEDKERLSLVTKLLYNDVAKKCHTSFQSVERNIKTVSQVAWTRNRPRLEELAQIALPKPPSPAEFIEILASQFPEFH